MCKLPHWFLNWWCSCRSAGSGFGFLAMETTFQKVYLSGPPQIPLDSTSLNMHAQTTSTALELPKATPQLVSEEQLEPPLPLSLAVQLSRPSSSMRKSRLQHGCSQEQLFSESRRISVGFSNGKAAFDRKHHGAPKPTKGKASTQRLLLTAA